MRTKKRGTHCFEPKKGGTHFRGARKTRSAFFPVLNNALRISGPCRNTRVCYRFLRKVLRGRPFVDFSFVFGQRCHFSCLLRKCIVFLWVFAWSRNAERVFEYQTKRGTLFPGPPKIRNTLFGCQENAERVFRVPGKCGTRFPAGSPSWPSQAKLRG